MRRFNRRSGYSLVTVGALGIAFFWVTDPRYGLALRWSHGENPIDLANWHFPGTVLGIVASAMVLVIGLYLLSRKVT
jgi:uncharacterized membrane protein